MKYFAAHQLIVKQKLDKVNSYWIDSSCFMLKNKKCVNICNPLICPSHHAILTHRKQINLSTQQKVLVICPTRTQDDP